MGTTFLKLGMKNILLAVLTVCAVACAGETYFQNLPLLMNWERPNVAAMLDTGTVFQDVNGDGLVDIVYHLANQAAIPAQDSHATLLNNGCEFVDASTLSPTNNFTYCTLPGTVPVGDIMTLEETAIYLRTDVRFVEQAL